MRVLVQRVSRATVSVDGEVRSSIGLGYLLFVGVGRGDEATQVDRLADKVVSLRIFRDADGKTNLAIADVDGEALVVSQFTLYADTRKGRRPSFVYAADPQEAAELEVELVNDGPFTLWLDVETS